MQLRKKVNTLVNLSINYLSMLSIRSKKIYVFGAWQGNTFSDNPKYLYLQARKDKSIKAVWITRNKQLYNHLKAHGLDVHLHNSLSGIYYQLRAAVYFTCMSKQDVFSLILGNATRINLWHGVGLKKILSDDKITRKSSYEHSSSAGRKIWSKINAYPRRKQFILSTSDQMTEIFARAFNKEKQKILQLGQPRNDVFFCDDLEFDKFPYKGLSKKIILYMPTHRLEGKKRIILSDIFDLDVLNRFCAEHNFLFLVKKHYYHNQESEDLKNFKSIIDITNINFDGQVLLKHADVLITDYSSCFVDYLLLDRPVIFYNYDYAEYVINDRDLYFDYESTTPGEKVKNFPELLNSLHKIMVLGEDAFGAERKRVKNIFYSEDNQKTVGEKILSYVKEKC